MSRIAFLILAVFALSCAAQVPPERDTQIWTDAYVTIPIIKKADKKTPKVSIVLVGTLRFGRNLSRPVDERIAAGLEFRVNRYLTLTPAYLYRADQPFAGRRESESRIRLDVGIERQFKAFSIKDRNRIEHRFRNSRSDSTRYRNKIQIAIPVKRNGKEIFAPFVADEPYFEFQLKKFTRNEFSAGISKKFSPTVSADFYYLLQNNRGFAFKYVNAFGIALKIKIDR